MIELGERSAAALIAVLGLCVGSFLNVVIARLPAGESIVRPRSKCPKCQRQLSWYENVPVLSWVFLRGRCRSCKTPISPRYVVVEILVGALYLACYQRFDMSWQLVPALVMVSLLVPLTFIDAEHWVLPFELTLPGIALGILLAIPLGLDALKVSVIGAVVGFVSLRALEFFGWLAFKKEAMGAGDKFLFALLGAFLGFRPLLGLMLLASFQGAVVGIARLLFTGRAGPASQPSGDAAAADEAPPTMTWEFMKPGVPLFRRLWLLPYCLLLQPIPDEPQDEGGQEIEWQPGATNLPFGPWLALAGIEVLLLGPWLSEHITVLQLEWMFAS